MAAEQDETGTFRGARFNGADFTGATFRDCDLRRLKVVDSWLVDVNISGMVGNLVVNDVDVTTFVESELERRHPERVQLQGDAYGRRLPSHVGHDRAPLVRGGGPRPTPA